MKPILVTLLTAFGVCGSIALGQGETKNASSAVATAAPAEISGPKIKFAETVFDFGKVKAGEVVRHDFVFTNTGTATLEIAAVKPGCGCTTAGTWDKQVEPGKTGSIPLQFNSTGFGGTVAKSASVTCNDPGLSNLVLLIKGTVWRPIDVTPAVAVFNLQSETQTNETKVVRIVNNLEEPLDLSDLQCSNKAFQAELKTVRPGKEFELHITAVPPFTVPSITAPVTLKTSSTNMPTITVNAYVTVQQPVVVTPAQIILPAGALVKTFDSVVAIRTTGTNTLALSDASVNIPGAEVRVQEIQPGHFFSLMVNFPAGLLIKPGQKVEMSVKSNHPRFPLITVPVFQPQPSTAPAAAPHSVSASGTSPAPAGK